MTVIPAGLETVDIRLVSLAVTVSDGKGNPVKGLTKEDFEVYDAGNLIEIEKWDNAPAPLAVVLVIDSSLTMQGKKIAAAKDAALDFIRELTGQDKVAVLAFSEQAELLAALEGERDDAVRAVRGIETAGGTALYDAVFSAAKLLGSTHEDTRRIAVVLSDGRDEAATGLEPGSFHTLEEAVRQAHRNDVAVFTIGLGSGLDTQPDFTGRMTTAQVLERLATSTGGQLHRIRRWSRLTRTYRNILEELRHQYHLAYPPPEKRAGETWRAVEVRVKRRGANVRTREGYYVD